MKTSSRDLCLSKWGKYHENITYMTCSLERTKATRHRFWNDRVSFLRSIGFHFYTVCFKPGFPTCHPQLPGVVWLWHVPRSCDLSAVLPPWGLNPLGEMQNQLGVDLSINSNTSSSSERGFHSLYVSSCRRPLLPVFVTAWNCFMKLWNGSQREECWWSV